MSNPNQDQHECPPEFAEIYSEICDQVMRCVAEKFVELRSTTIMRELPHAFQINALLTGALVGALVPLIMTVRGNFPGKSAEYYERLRVMRWSIASSLPKVFDAANTMVDEIEKGRCL